MEKINKPNIAIAFSAVGNGHFTQAVTVANYIKDRFNISFVGVTCLNDCNEDELRTRIKMLIKDGCDIRIYKATNLGTTSELRNKLKTQLSVLYYTTMNINNLNKLLKKNNCILVLDFFTNTYGTYHIPVIKIARQFISIDNQLNNIFYRTLKTKTIFNAAICLTKHEENNENNNFIDFHIPPLIDNRPMVRNVIPNTCLVYTRDKDYCPSINTLVKKHPSFKFNIFTNHINEIDRNVNVIVNKPSIEFKNYLTTTDILITTSGVESICEALFNEIPVILFKPDIGDEEQTFNYNFYIRNKMASPFSHDVDLSNSKLKYRKSKWFKKYCLSAQQHMHRIIDVALEIH